MINDDKKQTHAILVTTFNSVLRIEETFLKKSPYNDLTLKELRLVEMAYQRGKAKEDNTAGTISRELQVTPGTLTTAVKLLEKKGYLKRVQDTKDKRSVHILATERGEKVNLEHLKFHGNMAEAVTHTLTQDEAKGFEKGLTALNEFFKKQETNL